jgi:hypothetical protein
MLRGHDLGATNPRYGMDHWSINGRGGDPTRWVRRPHRCRICGRVNPDQRLYCSYCVQYVP